MTDRTVVYRIQADVTQAKAQVAAFGASVRKAADDATAATKEGAKWRAGLDQLGGTAGKVGLVAAAGLGAAVLKVADFDQAMSSVQAATHESAAAMDSLRQAALDAGQETAFSATEAAAGIENLAKAGVSTAEILDGGLNGALSLAAAGGMEVADAAEAAAGAMAQFGLSGDQVPHIADLLAAAAGKAQGDVSDFTMALKQGGTVAAQTGLSLEETTGALAAMAEQSLLGSDAGTSFKTMLASLTPNSDKAAKAMEAYNIHAFDAQGNFVGMTELAGQLQAGLGDLTDEQRAMALETIFGSDAVRAASIIYDNGAEGIANWTAKVNDAGFAAETAAIKQDNLRGDIEKLGGALETALIGTGSGSQGPLRSLVQSLEGAVNAYNELGEGAKSGVGVALAATAGLGGGLFVFSKVVQSVSATREAMEALGITSESAANKVKALGPAIAVVAGASLASLANDLGDVDYSIGEMGRQLELIAAQGDAAGVLESLSFSAENLGEALRDAAWNDFNMFGLGASDEIKELDAALAGLDPTVAAEAFKVITEEGERAGLKVSEISDLFPQYAAELDLTAKEAEAAASASDALAGSSGRMGEAVAKSMAVIEAEAKALDEARKAARESAESFFGLGDALNDASVSLGGWLRQMENQADALNNFTANAQRAGKRGLREGLISALQDAGTEGALRLKQLANATDAEINRANRAWSKGQRAIDNYVDATTKVPSEKSTTLTLNDNGAAQKLAAYKNSLEALRDRNLTITTVYRVVGNATDALPARANGGPIYGPGTKTSDSIPAMLSTGEYVIKAAAVDHYGLGFFDKANAMRLADGGSTDKKRRRPAFDNDGRPEATITAQALKDLVRATDIQMIAAQDQAQAAKAATWAAEQQVKAAEDNLEAAENSLQATQQMRDSLASSVSGQFSNSLTGGGLSGLMRTLSTDINAGSSMDATLQALVAAGLDTTGASAGLFQELAASTDQTTANQLLAAGPEVIAMLEQQYAQRAQINTSRGEFVAGASYDALIAQQTAAVGVAEQQVAQMSQMLAQREAQHAQSVAQIEQLRATVAEQAQAFASAVNSTASSAAQSRPSGNANVGRWR